MSSRKPIVASEISIDRSKYPVSKSPAFKNLPVEVKSQIYQSQVKRLKALPRKSSVKYIKFTSSNSISTAARESYSENRRKVGDLLASQNSNPYLQFNESLTKKKKQVNLKYSSINSFMAKLDKKLDLLQNSIDLKSLDLYLSALDNIIERDAVFGSILKKIRNGLKIIYDKYSEVDEYCKSLEIRLSEKQSIINQHLINKRNDVSLLNEIENERNYLDVKEKNTMEESKYISVPYQQWIEVNYRLDDVNEKARKLENENLEMGKDGDKVKSLELEIVILKEKESKFNILLQALTDRGYPIQEIYSTDVLNIESHLSNPSQSNIIKLKSYHQLSSDSSLASVPLNMDYL